MSPEGPLQRNNKKQKKYQEPGVPAETEEKVDDETTEKQQVDEEGAEKKEKMPLESETRLFVMNLSY